MNAAFEPTLHGSRLTLRPITSADTDAMLAATREPETNRLTGTTRSFTREEIEQWCERIESAEDRIDLAITDPATGEFLGEVLLNEIDAGNRSAAFRIALSSSHCGLAYGSEACRPILGHGLDVLGLNRVALEALDAAAQPRVDS